MLSSNEEWLDDIYDANVLSEIAILLDSSDWKVVKPALKVISHFASGSDRQVTAISSEKSAFPASCHCLAKIAIIVIVSRDFWRRHNTL